MKKIIPLFFILFSAAMLYAENLATLTGSEHMSILLKGDSITEVQYKNPKPVLLPNIAGIKNLALSIQKDLDPNYYIESLYLYKKPETAHKEVWTADERAALYNQSLALSTLAGIQYFSTTRKAMRVFYEISTIIDNPEAKNPRPDPSYFVPPKELILYARQKDLTFGDNIYKYTYQAEDSYLLFIQENLTTMSAGIIPVAGKNKLHSLVAVIDAGEYLLIYVVSMADAASVPGMGQRVGDSFSNRANAIIQWFKGQADKAFASVK